MYDFNMDNNLLWSNKPKLGNRPISSDFFNKDYGTVKYYSGIDAEIYFEGIFIDDVVQINFMLQQNTMPLFGYNSYVYDELAVGSRIINGQFTINFTKAEFMYDAIEQLSQVKASSKKDIVYDRKHSPILNKTFNIVLSYGKNSSSGFSSANGTTQLYLMGVQLTGCTQQLAISGEPIYETYTFIAQDLLTSLPKSNSKQQKDKEKDNDISIEENENYTLNIKSAEYSEETSNKQENKIVGKIKLQLDTDLDIKSISINPKINTENSQATKNIEVTDEKTIVYVVSSELRSDIFNYYKNNNYSMPADFFAEYIENGETCMTELKTIDIKLKNIIND